MVIAAAMAAAALTNLSHPPAWAAVLTAAAAFAVGLALDPFKKMVAEWIEHPRQRRAVLLSHTRMHDRAGRIQRVRNCSDALAWGVHPAEQVHDLSPAVRRLPPYVRRDVHAQLGAEIGFGGMVIIEGASTAGKSRLGFEVAHAYLADRQLIVPAGLTSLKEIAKAGVPIREAVIWLDDVERYLTSGGLDGAVLDALVPSGCADVLILATLRSQARTELTSADLETSTARAAEEVMRRARIIPLELGLTATEHERAQELRSDERIAAALDQSSDVGFAEYLAAGPATLERWQAARRGQHPVAGAIISAAIDVSLTGFQEPIPRTLLEDLYLGYLEVRIRNRTAQFDFEQALDWATHPVNGASGCLIPMGDATYQPFDYLVDHIQATRPVTEIPATIWHVVLAHATTSDLLGIGFVAYEADQIEISKKANRRAADSGDTDAMYNLGLLFQRAGRKEKAERWYRRAADTGHASAMNNLGILLDGSGRKEEAETWFHRSAVAGDDVAAFNLGNLLRELGRKEEAEQWYRQGAKTGHIGAMNNLGTLLAEAGRGEEAEKLFQRVIDAGNLIDGLWNLALLRSKTRNSKSKRSD